MVDPGEPLRSDGHSSGFTLGFLRVELVEHLLHKLLAVNSFAAVQRSKTLVNAGAKLFKVNGLKTVALVKQPQSFADHFACRTVTATLNFGLDQCFQFGSQRDVHKMSSDSSMSPFPHPPPA